MIHSTRSAAATTGPRYSTLALFLLLVATITLPTGNVGAQTATSQLVGFTSSTAPGNAGMPTLNRLCQLEFPESRMCTTDEIVTTVAPPLTAVREYAWVHSLLVTSVSSRSSVFDSLGTEYEVGGNQRPNCMGWSSAGTNGPVITTDTGAATIRMCSEAHRVACCGPSD